MNIRPVVISLGMVLLSLMTGLVKADTVLASGLWRADHARKTTYLCIDHNFQPWRMLPVVMAGPAIGEGEFRDSKGGKSYRHIARLERRDWVEGGAYLSESTYTLQYKEPVSGGRVLSETATVIRRSWQGDFTRRIDFRETKLVFSDAAANRRKGTGLPRDSAVMRRVGVCPSTLPPGGKCQLLKSTARGDSEWPACDLAVERAAPTHTK